MSRACRLARSVSYQGDERNGRVQEPSATSVKVRRNRRIVSVAVIVAVGVNAAGRRELLGRHRDLGPSEAQTFWVEFLRKLRRRAYAGSSWSVSDCPVVRLSFQKPSGQITDDPVDASSRSLSKAGQGRPRRRGGLVVRCLRLAGRQNQHDPGWRATAPPVPRAFGPASAARRSPDRRRPPDVLRSAPTRNSVRAHSVLQRIQAHGSGPRQGHAGRRKH
jgi:Transposase, Mutator family